MLIFLMEAHWFTTTEKKNSSHSLYWESYSGYVLKQQRHNHQALCFKGSVYSCENVENKISSIIAWETTRQDWTGAFSSNNSLRMHRALLIQQFLQNNNIEVFSHAPYSPDLVPSYSLNSYLMFDKLEYLFFRGSSSTFCLEVWGGGVQCSKLIIYFWSQITLIPLDPSTCCLGTQFNWKFVSIIWQLDFLH